MERVTLKFPDLSSYQQFNYYIKTTDCERDVLNLSLTCEHDPVEVKIAVEIFKAVVVEYLKKD